MSLVPEIDYGTPASRAEKMVTLTIDGNEITVPEGTSIMRASMEAGIKVPKLCATDMVDAFGSCRLCLVEIEGRNGTPASCTTPVAPGLVVHTQTGRLKDIRKGVMELYISDHPLDCLTCAANGDCELQDMAGAVGLRDVRYGYEGDNHVKARNSGEINAKWMPKDESNPYFTYDPSKCIVCSRCVRACEEVQGTFALTIEGRGFGSRVSPGMHEHFVDSECVSCGACVQACPTATLTEKSVIDIGQPEHSVVTTCAYCGVGCSFKAEMRGEELVRMVPWKDGQANRGHSCVKGRFAYGYSTHKDRILNPMIREKISDPWREVTWDEAYAHVAGEFRRIQYQYGRDSIGGITSSRCTNEETYLVQKLIRAGFGNNNVDTCARVCHSPTGYGLGQTFGTSAGTQNFDSVEHTDVVIVIGANPTDGHPVFASRLKKRLRQGAKLIVIDPRRTELVSSPHIKASYHLPLKPGTNVAIVTALAHVIVTEGLYDERFIRERCDWSEFEDWAAFVAEPRHSPEAIEQFTGVDPETLRGAARLYRDRRQRLDLLRSRRHRTQPGLDDGHRHRQPRHGHRQYRPRGCRREPAARPEQRAGLVRHGLLPARAAGLSAHFRRRDPRDLRKALGREAQQRAGPAHPQHAGRRRRGHVQGPLHPGRGHPPVRSGHANTSPPASPRWNASSCRISSSTRRRTTPMSSCRARPSSRRTAPSPMPSAASTAFASVMTPKNGYADWEVTQNLAQAMGLNWNYRHPSEIMDEIAATTPSFALVSYDYLEKMGSVQWPCNEKSAARLADHAHQRLRARQG
jgi:formate dehydrogenase major subunit